MVYSCVQIKFSSVQFRHMKGNSFSVDPVHEHNIKTCGQGSYMSETTDQPTIHTIQHRLIEGNHEQQQISFMKLKLPL